MTMMIIRPRQHGLRAAHAVFHPRDLTAIGLVIERLEAMESGPELEADIFRALGWRAEGPAAPRACWRVRSPLASTWMPMPPVTRLTDGTAILVPPGWDYGSGRRRGHGFGWTSRDQATFFEATSADAALALCRAALHGWRRILMESE